MSAVIPDASILLQDLLSPASTKLPSTTPALITYHLSLLPSNSPLLPSLLHYILVSPSLWRGQSTPSSSTPRWSALNFERGKDVFEAVRNGVFYRAGEVSKSVGDGWRGRRALGGFLDVLLAGMEEAEESHPAIKLLLNSAILAGLQAVKNRKDKLYVGGSGLLGKAEGEVIKAWEGLLGTEEEVGVGEWMGSGRGEYEMGTRRFGEDLIAPWLAAQTLPMFPIDILGTGPLPALLSLLTQAFSTCFAHGTLFEDLPSDFSTTSAGSLHWNTPSPSHELLSSLVVSPHFIILGPLSRAIGRCIEAAAHTPRRDAETEGAAFDAVRVTIDTLERVTARIHSGWSRCPTSDLAENDTTTMDEATKLITLPWTILKTLLFSLTLLESSLLVLITPVQSYAPTIWQRTMARQSMRVLGSTYFVASQFGPDGFGAWKGVWTGLVEVLSGMGEGEVESLMRELEPREMGILHDRRVERSTTTFYLDVAEQLMENLGNTYLEERVLTCCRPYLENPKYRETFESSHSVLLSIFALEKSIANQLAPWYTALLIKACPSLMSAGQLRLAYTTMIKCVSSSDDALAWYCILELIRAIRSIPLASSPSPLALSSSTSTSTAHAPIALGRALDIDEDTTTTRLEEAEELTPLEQSALSLPRGHLLLTLIDQTKSVNLILLRTLLGHIWDFIKEERGGEGKEALVQIMFGTLGEGLDATKRDEGVRYWMDRGGELRGETVRSLL